MQERPPCWCHFIQALYAVSLNSVAEEAKAHLKLSHDITSSSGTSADVTEAKPHLGCCDDHDATTAPSDANKNNSGDVKNIVKCLKPYRKKIILFIFIVAFFIIIIQLL